MNSELEKRQEDLKKNIWSQVFENENAMFSFIKNRAYKSDDNASIKYISKEDSGEEYDVKILDFIPKTVKNHVHLTGYHTIENGIPQYQKYVLKYKSAQITFDLSESPDNFRIIYSIVDGDEETELAMVSEKGEGRFPICNSDELNEAKKRLAEGGFPTIWNIISESLKNHKYAPSVLGDFRQIKSLGKSTSIKPLTETQKHIMALSRENDLLKEIIRGLTQGRKTEGIVRLDPTSKLPDGSDDGFPDK